MTSSIPICFHTATGTNTRRSRACFRPLSPCCNIPPQQHSRQKAAGLRSGISARSLLHLRSRNLRIWFFDPLSNLKMYMRLARVLLSNCCDFLSKHVVEFEHCASGLLAVPVLDCLIHFRYYFPWTTQRSSPSNRESAAENLAFAERV
jgi:hypothetical protein